MDHDKPMKIVLVEDDVSACRDFIDYANTRTDIIFVGVTGRGDEGLELVKRKMPEAVILDLELSYGKGSGFDFLDDFCKTEFSIRPIVVITTRNRNDTVHTMLHTKYNIDCLFYKLQEGYGPEMVIRHLLRFREFYHARESGTNSEFKSLETPEELERRIMGRIKAELNAFGISTKYKGRRTAEEAIYMLLCKGSGDSETVFIDLARKHNLHYNNITRNIQNAINKVWNNPTNLEELLKHYTAPVNKDVGAPTPTEFIHFYADKIRPDL